MLDKQCRQGGRGLTENVTIEENLEGGRGSQAAPGDGKSEVPQWLGEEKPNLTEVHSQQLNGQTDGRESRYRKAAGSS